MTSLCDGLRRASAALSAVVLLVGGCSAEQVYNAAAGWRRNECNRFGDAQQRERCLKEADRPYEAYRAATDRGQ
jgi:hypothetical protein